jgi:hypothetical protein
MAAVIVTEAGQEGDLLRFASFKFCGKVPQ